jgi:hypothetical protein
MVESPHKECFLDGITAEFRRHFGIVLRLLNETCLLVKSVDYAIFRQSRVFKVHC